MKCISISIKKKADFFAFILIFLNKNFIRTKKSSESKTIDQLQNKRVLISSDGFLSK